MPSIEARMRQLIGTTAEWIADDIVIGDGEIALERTEEGVLLIKVGNGVDQYGDLPYLTLSAFGSDYSWRVAGSVTSGGTRTAPDHPIQVNVRVDFAPSPGTATLVVQGIEVGATANGGNGQMVTMMSGIVPPNATYSINWSGVSLITVTELRAD